MLLFSIIVPVYNAEKTITRCVQSILESAQDDCEIILVDDCSKDRSRDICREFQRQYPQVHFLENEINRGVSYTRNKGIDFAKGKYLLFVDSDDYVAPNFISSFRMLAEGGAIFAITAYYSHDEGEKGDAKQICWDSKDIILGLKIQETIEMLQDKVLLQQLWNKLFVTQSVKKYNIRFDENISFGEDTRFILEYLRYNAIKDVTVFNQPTYHYIRVRAGSLTNKVGCERVEELTHNFYMLYQIAGYNQEQIADKIEKKRLELIGLYSYWIMHNKGMKYQEKKRLILKLDPTQGRRLLKKQLWLYFKEKIAKYFRRVS